MKKPKNSEPRYQMEVSGWLNAPASFAPEDTVPSTHSVEGWVDPDRTKYLFGKWEETTAHITGQHTSAEGVGAKSVSELTGYGLDNRGSSPVRAGSFLRSPAY